MGRNLKDVFRKVKVLDLIMDWNIWPRFEAKELSRPHVVRMREAYKAGFVLPPPLVDAKSYRIVDGFHRIKAYREAFGDDAIMTVEVRKFSSDREILLESARLNTIHGIPLTNQDRVHCILRLRELKATWEEIAVVLNITDKKAMEFFKVRVLVTGNGRKIPTPKPALNALNKKMDQEGRVGEERYLTEEEENLALHSGPPAMQHTRLLMNYLKAGACPLNKKELEVLLKLREEIGRAIRKYHKRRR